MEYMATQNIILPICFLRLSRLLYMDTIAITAIQLQSAGNVIKFIKMISNHFCHRRNMVALFKIQRATIAQNSGHMTLV